MSEAKKQVSGAKKRTRHRKMGPGLTFKQFAVETDIPLPVVLRMAEKGQIAVVDFGDKMKRIPRAEATKILETMG